MDTQKAAVSPRQLKILKMDTLRLNQYLNDMMMENPVIEIEENLTGYTDEDMRTRKAEWLESNDFEEGLGYFDKDAQLPQDEDTDYAMLNVGEEETLEQHLLTQLAVQQLPERIRSAAEYLVGCLDENGYLLAQAEDLIAQGYCQALLAGNALATHDLEGGYLGTALGCDIVNQKLHFMGHYNHLDAINAINTYGSIPAFIEGEGINSGIIYNCVKHNVPFVLNGSIRDDGPLPEVYEHTYEGQDTIRSHVRKATTVIGMATVLHTIATGNMTPTYRVLGDGTIRPVHFYMVDTSEFAANTLGDRGSLSAKGIVTNVQDFMRNISTGLGI